MDVIKCCYGCVGIGVDTVINAFLFCENLKDTKTVNILLNLSFQLLTKFYLSRYEFQMQVVVAAAL